MGHQNNPNRASVNAEKRGIDRRTLIKGAAVAGVVGWTAPVILDSLTSPAAAITGPHGCTGVTVNGSTCHPENQGTPCTLTLCAANNAAISPCLSHTGDCQNGVVTFFANATGCETCRFTAAEAKTGSTCVNPTGQSSSSGFSLTSVSFPHQATPGYAQYYFNITCG